MFCLFKLTLAQGLERLVYILGINFCTFIYSNISMSFMVSYYNMKTLMIITSLSIHTFYMLGT